jgi:hypothetical protein
MSLQAYIRLLNIGWHKGSLKAKLHEATTLKKVPYTWQCSSIYRKDELASYKITIMSLEVLHTLFTNDIRAILYFLPPLLRKSWPSSRESFFMPKLITSNFILSGRVC